MESQVINNNMLLTSKLKKEIRIGKRKIGPKHPCFIIAEAGVNHKLSLRDLKRTGLKNHLQVAFKLVDEAKSAGVEAIKFQSFSAETLIFKKTKKPLYQVRNVGKDEKISYYDMLQALETSKKDQVKIAHYCERKNIQFLSTPYDNESVVFLDKVIKVPAFKMASIELNNHLFVSFVAKKRKPIILSTGLGDIFDVKNLISLAKKERFIKKLILLQCTSDYPTPAEDINLNVLKSYLHLFPDVLIGLSDHSITDTASLGAVAIGASVLEKHFTLDKTFSGPDHAASLDVNELNSWVKRVREMESSMGDYQKTITPAEKKNISMKKYLVITPQKRGTEIREKMLLAMRTGKGILPVTKNLNKIIGKRLTKDVEVLLPLSWDLIN